MCCRPPNSPPSHGPEQPAGHWGEFKCDLPFATANNLLEHLAQNKKEFDWIYWTGDLPAHDDWNQTRSDQQLLLQLLTKQMKFYLGDVKIYPTLGNHESAPVNRLAISYNNSYILYTMKDLMQKSFTVFMLFYMSAKLFNMSSRWYCLNMDLRENTRGSMKVFSRRSVCTTFHETFLLRNFHGGYTV